MTVFRILHFLSGIALALAVTFFAICAKADSTATMTASITVVEAISVDEQGLTSGDAVPVPTDDGSVNY